MILSNFSAALQFLPSLDEQKAIVKYIDCEISKLDALVTRTSETIDRLQEYHSALISAAVTGKIDVRGEVS